MERDEKEETRFDWKLISEVVWRPLATRKKKKSVRTIERPIERFYLWHLFTFFLLSGFIFLLLLFSFLYVGPP